MASALLETLVSTIAAAIVAFAKLIMTDTITVFTEGQNVFDTFVSLIPFGSIPIGQIIKGIAYCIVFSSIFIVALTPTLRLIKGEDTLNLTSAYLRCFITIFLIGIIFGIDFNIDGSTYDFINGGLLGQIGSLFGTVLSYVGISVSALSIIPVPSFTNFIYSFEFFLEFVLLISVLLGIVGAALTYVERIISFALSIIVGPICVAFYANAETEETAKNWAMSILTQFLAILLSLVLWNAFIIKLGDAFSDSSSFSFSLDENFGYSITLLHYAVAIALLGLIKNSEKILNSFGLRTVSLGDSARMAATGLAATFSGLMLAGRAFRSYRGSIGAGKKEENIVSPYDEMNNLDVSKNESLSGKGLGTASIKDYMFNLTPASAKRESIAQLEARNNLLDPNKTTFSADEFNTAYGLKDSSLKAIGTMQKVEVKDPETNKTLITGFTGNFQYDHNGMSTTYNDYFVLGTHAEGVNYKKLDGVVVGDRVITPSTSPSIDNRGNHIYKTVPYEPENRQKSSQRVTEPTYTQKQSSRHSSTRNYTKNQTSRQQRSGSHSKKEISNTERKQNNKF